MTIKITKEYSPFCVIIPIAFGESGKWEINAINIAFIMYIMRMEANWFRHWFRRAKAEHLRLGRKGESIAAQILQERGMELLCRNYRAGHGEIDLVFREEGVLCFVEVKTRHRQRMGRPIDAVNAQKRLTLLSTARYYLRDIGKPPVKCRFDVVEVVFEKSKLWKILHWKNVFSF